MPALFEAHAEPTAAMESFFSSLKTERIAREVYRSRDEAKADVFDYIERFLGMFRGPAVPSILALSPF